jgi:hypothetical protein
VPAPLPPPAPTRGLVALALPVSLGPVPATDAVVGETVVVRPLADPVVDVHGYDPRSSYVELFWLGVLGPSSVWLLRRIAAGFEAWPDGFELDVHETADALGLAAGHRNSTFTRTVMRVVSFGMARIAGDGLEVRRRIPPLPSRHLARLPVSLRQAHRAWASAGHGDADARREHERAHAAAHGLLSVGDEPEHVERLLQAMGIRPRLAAQAVAWALTHVHATALAPAGDAA